MKAMKVHITHFSVMQFLAWPILEGKHGSEFFYETSQPTLRARNCIQYILFPQAWRVTTEITGPEFDTYFRDYEQISP